jgi:GxxExxY protein
MMLEDYNDRYYDGSVSKLPDITVAQVMSYLKATGLKRGLLINFGMQRLVDGVKRISL